METLTGLHYKRRL